MLRNYYMILRKQADASILGGTLSLKSLVGLSSLDLLLDGQTDNEDTSATDKAEHKNNTRWEHD